MSFQPLPKPSLNCLRAVEAAIRLRSMTIAAEELHVTPGAVSKHVQSLEAQFGIVLAKRLPRSLEPTPEGARLGATLTAAFGLMDDGIAQLKPGPLVLSCSASIMMRWLIPRLADFRKLCPNIPVQIVPDHSSIDMMREGVSLAIRNDVIAPPQDVVVRPLMPEWIGPVCSPEYAQSIGIETPKDLPRAQLLVTATRTSAWSDWFRAVGEMQQTRAQAEIYPHFYMTLHAAACGLGMAIAPRFLVAEDLKEGRLVAPFGFVQGHRNVVMWLSSHLRKREDIRLLSEWMQKQATPSQ